MNDHDKSKLQQQQYVQNDIHPKIEDNRLQNVKTARHYLGGAFRPLWMLADLLSYTLKIIFLSRPIVKLFTYLFGTKIQVFPVKLKSIEQHDADVRRVQEQVTHKYYLSI
jgi:hypothetical protein